MKEGRRYSYVIKDPPGVNVRKLREAHGWTLRQMADKSHPPLDYTTIQRLEHNKGYTHDTLERVAKVLGVTVANLFLPPELADWPSLPEPVKARIAESVQDALAGVRYRATKPGFKTG